MKPDWATSDQSVVLYNADCMEVLPHLSGVDAVVTDPPYGLADKLQGGTWGKVYEGEDCDWDAVAPQTLLERALSLAGTAIVWGGNYFLLPPSRCWLVWHKRDAVQTMADCELAWTNFDANARLIDQTIAATNAERCGHPTQKPLRVMEWSLSFVPDATTILDPFMGSGTTGVACVRLGRRFIGIEKERKYFDIAVNRITDELNRAPLFDKPPQIQRTFLGETA